MRGIMQEIRVPGLYEPMSHYTDANRCGDFLFLSGKPPFDKNGNVVCRGDVVGQARQVLENIKRTLKAAGMAMQDVCTVTVYMIDVRDRPKINPMRKKYFGKHRPASTLVGVTELAVPGMLVEIQAIAYRPGSGEAAYKKKGKRR
jgi:enamine deaminase RidA (YjgF/YER057c/UK114 family)